MQLFVQSFNDELNYLFSLADFGQVQGCTCSGIRNVELKVVL